MFKYTVNLAWSDEDNGYIATVAEFDGLSAFGDTPEEAIKEVKSAVRGFIAVLKEDGEEIPEPKGIPSYSGQIRLNEMG